MARANLGYLIVLVLFAAQVVTREEAVAAVQLPKLGPVAQPCGSINPQLYAEVDRPYPVPKGSYNAFYTLNPQVLGGMVGVSGNDNAPATGIEIQNSCVVDDGDPSNPIEFVEIRVDAKNYIQSCCALGPNDHAFSYFILNLNLPYTMDLSAPPWKVYYTMSGSSNAPMQLDCTILIDGVATNTHVSPNNNTSPGVPAQNHSVDINHSTGLACNKIENFDNWGSAVTYDIKVKMQISTLGNGG